MTHMWIDVLLAFLAFATVVIAVVGDARKAKKRIDRFGVATIGVATLIFLFTIAHGWNESRAKAEYVAQLEQKFRAQLDLEATRLRYTDFQIDLTVDYPGDVDGELPKQIEFSGEIGKASFFGTFEKSSVEHRSKAEGEALGTHSFDYKVHRIAFDRLYVYQYLQDVDRKPFVLQLDTGKMPRGRRESIPTHAFFLTILIQGQRFEARSTASGKFETVIRLAPATQAK